MTENEIENFIEEVRNENHITPFRTNEEFIPYVKDGEFDINEYCGTKINYTEDLQARRLLKNYVLYADYKRLAEFKQLYIGEYDALQRKYFINSNIQ